MRVEDVIAWPGQVRLISERLIDHIRSGRRIFGACATESDAGFLSPTCLSGSYACTGDQVAVATLAAANNVLLNPICFPGLYVDVDDFDT
jgi:hypothetical protein